MAKQNNRQCIICNQKYSFCPTCGADAGKPTWYHIFDGERCHEIYEICVSYRDKIIDIREAYERISKLDLSDLENFAPSTKAQIEEILSNTKAQSVATVENKEKETVALPKTNNTKTKVKK